MILINNDIKIKDVTNIINENAPSFSGIVNGDCKGKVWVDNIEVPRFAIVESYAVGGFALLGKYEDKEDLIKLKYFLETEFFNHLKKNGYDCFEFSIENEYMRNNILEMFKNRSIHTENEYSFRTSTIPKKPYVIPKEYQLNKIDTIFWNMLLAGEYENVDFVKNRLLESWNSFNEFINKSVAYCILYKKEIVAVMIGTACYNNIVAIDIETEIKHRRMGLAYVMATEFIAECLEKNYIPQWDCVESNLNSYNLAKKLGFELINKNIVYWFDI